METVSRQETVKISKQLDLIFRKHFDRVYMITWVMGFIRSYSGKETVLRKIKEQWSEINATNARKFRHDMSQLSGIDKFRQKLSELIGDLEKLSHAEFELLKTMLPEEEFGEPYGNSSIIKTIGGKLIEMED